MYLKNFTVGELQTNCYLIAAENTKQAAIIDPGGEVEPLLAEIRRQDFVPIYILLTHGHYDHIEGIAALKAKFPQLKICVHELDAAKLISPQENLSYYLGQDFTAPPADVLLKHGDVLTLGELSIKVLFLPGHSQGGVGYYLEKENVVFSGDSLFRQGIGRTDFADGSYPTLIAAIKNHLLTLPGETRVFPGHGPPTTIAHEKEENPFL